MTCEGNVCGIGTGITVLPSDPDNSMLLSATPAYGGVDLNWQLPLINPHAVAYVEVYRSQLNDFASSLRLAQVGGDFYFDKVAPGVLYYYWIRSVSINGTVGDVIGPASASAMPSIDQTIRDLTGKIDAGLLAKTLKEPIESIIPQGQAIIKEIEDRIAANAALSAALQQVRDGVVETMTYVQQETNQRKDGDSALVTQLNLLVAAVGDATAMIDEERIVRAGKDSALAQRIDTLYAEFESGGSGATALIQEEARVRADADGALSEKIDMVYAQVGTDTAAAVKIESDARVSGDQSLAQQITQAESNLNDNVAQVQQQLQTNIKTVGDKVTEIGSLYTVKLTANGLAGGFGVYNNGTTVQAGWDVDEFWVGRTSADMKKPFIISDGNVYIDQAVIQSIVFSKLRSDDGAVIVENGKLKASYIDTESLRITKTINGATMKLENGLFSVTDANGIARIELGLWG